MPISAAQVDEGDLHAPWFVSYSSFDASLRHTSTFTSVHELGVALSLHGHVDDLALTDPRLARGLDAARSRARGDFNAWSGGTGALPEPLRAQVDEHLSASTLQTWASCPASHLYGAVLGVRDLEDCGGDDTIDAREKGTFFTASSRSSFAAIWVPSMHQASHPKQPGARTTSPRPQLFWQRTQPP